MDIRELYVKGMHPKLGKQIVQNRSFGHRDGFTNDQNTTPDRSQTYRFFTGDAVVSGMDCQKAVRLDRYCVQRNNRKTDGRVYNSFFPSNSLSFRLNTKDVGQVQRIIILLSRIRSMRMPVDSLAFVRIKNSKNAVPPIELRSLSMFGENLQCMCSQFYICVFMYAIVYG
ncbi:hypothetical protein Avbf_00337 [Armadillidium vulgare]|nr:hypothetical protein Avbf_00337 [Armadillidium vulgare]